LREFIEEKNKEVLNYRRFVTYEENIFDREIQLLKELDQIKKEDYEL